MFSMIIFLKSVGSTDQNELYYAKIVLEGWAVTCYSITAQPSRMILLYALFA